jgi:hypothetical protein
MNPDYQDKGKKNVSNREKGGRKMNKKIFIIIFGFIILFAASPLFGQWTGTPGRRNVPVSESPCWTKPYMDVTPEQLKALEDLHRSFYKDILALRKKFITERDELSCLLSSPKIDAKLVLSKQNSLSAIQMKIDEISIQYLLKARALFAPEQLSNLPSGCNLGFNYGSGMGWGRGRGKTNRF